jgi:hypothetical protein
MIKTYDVFLNNKYDRDVHKVYSTLYCKDAIKYIEYKCKEQAHKDTDFTYWVGFSEVTHLCKVWYTSEDYCYYIHTGKLHGLEGLPEEYPKEIQDIIKLAISMLEKDPIAMDMAREVLKI